MLLPNVAIQRSGGGAERAGTLRWSETRDRAMHAMAVIVIAQGLQLSRQIGCVPEEDEVQVLAPDRADQTLNKRMRSRYAGDRLDLLDTADAQVGTPAVEAKQRIVIGADMLRWRLAGDPERAEAGAVARRFPSFQVSAAAMRACFRPTIRSGFGRNCWDLLRFFGLRPGSVQSRRRGFRGRATTGPQCNTCGGVQTLSSHAPNVPFAHSAMGTAGHRHSAGTIHRGMSLELTRS